MLVGCSESNDVGVQNPIGVNERNVVSDNMKAGIAKALALKMSNTQLRKFVKTEVARQFDGDNNFLLIETLDKMIVESVNGKTRSFKSILFGEKNDESWRVKKDSLFEFNPLIQVAVPNSPNFSNENWDTETTIPLVAYIPSKIVDDVIHAYDSEGKEVLLSASTAPTQPVVVISENERLIGFPKLTTSPNARLRLPCAEAYFSTISTDYYLMYDLNSVCDGGAGGGGTTPPLGNSQGACTRDSRQNKDVLTKMKFNSIGDLRDVNSWFDGGQELQITIVFATANGAITKLTKYASGNDRDFRSCNWLGLNCSPSWFNINQEILTWDKSIYGDAMLYNWLERDGGDPVEYTTSFSTTFNNSDGSKSTINNQIKFTYSDKDDLFGDAIVEYCDNANGDGYLYGINKMSFYVKEK
jgi:hypothetical protein